MNIPGIETNTVIMLAGLAATYIALISGLVHQWWSKRRNGKKINELETERDKSLGAIEQLRQQVDAYVKEQSHVTEQRHVTGDSDKIMDPRSFQLLSGCDATIQTMRKELDARQETIRELNDKLLIEQGHEQRLVGRTEEHKETTTKLIHSEQAVATLTERLNATNVDLTKAHSDIRIVQNDLAVANKGASDTKADLRIANAQLERKGHLTKDEKHEKIKTVLKEGHLDFYGKLTLREDRVVLQHAAQVDNGKYDFAEMMARKLMFLELMNQPKFIRTLATIARMATTGIEEEIAAQQEKPEEDDAVDGTDLKLDPM